MRNFSQMLLRSVLNEKSCYDERRAIVTRLYTSRKCTRRPKMRKKGLSARVYAICITPAISTYYIRPLSNITIYRTFSSFEISDIFHSIKLTNECCRNSLPYSDERVVGIRLLSNRISNVISNYDYCLQKVIVTK